MTRPLRIEYEDAYYHVMNRGRDRQCIFPDANYYDDFLACIDEAHKRFGIEIHAYCLMGNHYHLLIKTPRGNLSRSMRHIDGVYTQRHNRRNHTDGSLFRGRYKSIVIDASAYLLQVSRYIHRNPVELRIPLVTQLEDYSWSSFAAFINKKKAPDWLNRDTVYSELGSPQKYRGYQKFVEQGNDIDTQKFYQLKNTPSILGSKSFREQAYSKAQSLDLEIDKKGLKQPIPLSKIVQAVAMHYDVPLDDILKTKRGKGRKNVPRRLAMKLCQEVGGAKLLDIAKLFHVDHYSTVSQTISRLNRQLNEDARTSQAFNVLSQDLTP
jgi:putative transposase